MQQKIAISLDCPIEINSNHISRLVHAIQLHLDLGNRFTSRPPNPQASMSKQPRSRSGKQKALISAATSLFAQRGYEATTTREIAMRAGCAEGLIHRYFGGKSGLLLDIVRRHVAEDTATTIERPASATLEAEIRKLMDWQIDHLWTEREFLRVAFSCAILQPRLGKLLGKYMPARTEMIAQRLRRDWQNRFSNDEDIELLARALISLSFDFGFMRPTILRQNREHTKNLARRAANLLSRSIQ
jgi:AcrR family transcriptional regulator